MTNSPCTFALILSTYLFCLIQLPWHQEFRSTHIRGQVEYCRDCCRFYSQDWYLFLEKLSHKKQRMFMSMSQKKISQEKQQMGISHLLQLHIIRKEYPLIFQIRTLSIMLNQSSQQKLWIQLKIMLPLIRSEQRLVHYQVIVIRIIYLHISRNGIKTWRITIYHISIIKIK